MASAGTIWAACTCPCPHFVGARDRGISGCQLRRSVRGTTRMGISHAVDLSSIAIEGCFLQQRHDFLHEAQHVCGCKRYAIFFQLIAFLLSYSMLITHALKIGRKQVADRRHCIRGPDSLHATAFGRLGFHSRSIVFSLDEAEKSYRAANVFFFHKRYVFNL